MSLLLTIFLIVFLTQLVSWIGKAILLDHAYSLHLWITRSPILAKQRALRIKILENKTELLRTSAQDQFARWARLRREVDKGMANLETLNTQSTARKNAYTMKFNAILWTLTTGLQFAVGWWHRREAVFYLPDSWFGPLAWILALPFAPKGSVSVGVWQMACRRVLIVMERIIKELAAPSEVTTKEERTDERTIHSEKEKTKTL